MVEFIRVENQQTSMNFLILTLNKCRNAPIKINWRLIISSVWGVIFCLILYGKQSEQY